MDWDAIGALGEIGGAIAVFVTLIYLAIQIRQSRKQAELDAFRGSWRELNEFADRLSESIETASIVNRGRANLESLNENERLIFEHLHFRLLNTLEAWQRQVDETARSNTYREQQTANMAGVVQNYLAYPGVRRFWESYKDLYRQIRDLVDDNIQH